MWNVNVRGKDNVDSKKNELLNQGCIILEVTSIFEDWFGITFVKPSK